MQVLINFDIFSLNANCFLAKCDVPQSIAINIHFVDIVLLNTIFLLKTRQMCYTVSGDENEEIRDNH